MGVRVSSEAKPYTVTQLRIKVHQAARDPDSSDAHFRTLPGPQRDLLAHQAWTREVQAQAARNTDQPPRTPYS